MPAEDAIWEYCAVDDMRGSQNYSYPRVLFFTPEGEKIEKLSGGGPNAERNKVAMKIAALGNEGWEMVGMGSVYEGAGHVLYFKRKRK